MCFCWGGGSGGSLVGGREGGGVWVPSHIYFEAERTKTNIKDDDDRTLRRLINCFLSLLFLRLAIIFTILDHNSSTHGPRAARLHAARVAVFSPPSCPPRARPVACLLIGVRKKGGVQMDGWQWTICE